MTGIGVGILTVFGQKYLSMAWNFLANSGAIWLIPAFLLAYHSRQTLPHAIGLCTVCLLGCVYGYYLFEALLNQHTFFIGYYVLLWTACALVGGLIFGAGAYGAHCSSPRLQCLSRSLLPAIFLAEGLNHVFHIREYLHMLPAIMMLLLLGITLYVLIHRRQALVKQNLLALFFVTSLGLLGYEILFHLT